MWCTISIVAMPTLLHYNVIQTVSSVSSITEVIKKHWMLEEVLDVLETALITLPGVLEGGEGRVCTYM